LFNGYVDLLGQISLSKLTGWVRKRSESIKKIKILNKTEEKKVECSDLAMREKRGREFQRCRGAFLIAHISLNIFFCTFIWQTCENKQKTGELFKA